jgi:adenine-specific DNA-methyltransferase
VNFTPALIFNADDGIPDSHFLFGDNIAALVHVVHRLRLRGEIDLCYIDPPYNTGRDFTGSHGQAAYQDRWEDDDRFLEFLERRLTPLQWILSDRGSIYVHIDSRIGHYVKVLMDRVFGRDCFRSDITRIKCNPKNSRRRAYGNMKDVIYFYSRCPARGSRDRMIWNDFRLPLTDEQIKAQYPRVAADGRRYATVPIYGPGETRDGPTGQPWRGLMPPRGSHWSRSPAELDALDAAGLIEWSATGNPRKVIFADESPGNKVQDVLAYKDKGGRRDDYPTEKNLDLLRLIVLQSSLPTSTVIDVFAGSGTTLVAAAQERRRFVGADQSPAALAASLRRLTAETDAPFCVWTQDSYPLPVHGLETTVAFDGHTVRVQQLEDSEVPGANSVALIAAVRQDPEGALRCTALRQDRDRWLLDDTDQHRPDLLIIDRHGRMQLLDGTDR